MDFKITYSETITADTREEAVNEFKRLHSNVFDRNIKSEPLCPKGLDKGICYEMCQYRENGCCDLNFKV